MNEKLKRILPNSIVRFLIKKRNLYYLKKQYNKDRIRFKKSSYLLSNKWSPEKLRAKITLHYHSLEKGLSNENMRYRFGKRALTELFYSLDKYIELGYDISDTRFQQALNVLDVYIKVHHDNNEFVESVEQKFETYKSYYLHSYKVGFANYKLTDLPDFSHASYEVLVKKRHSIRDYGPVRIEDKLIYSSLEIAMKTPSACNRQPWKVYYMKHDKAMEILELQSGLTGNGSNLSGLLLITVDNQYYSGSHERNQSFIDGGMFATSLLYSLTAKNIATCTLHADLNMKNDKMIRDKLDIKNFEDLICFIAFGSYPEHGKYAVSPRDSYEQILIEI